MNGNPVPDDWVQPPPEPAKTIWDDTTADRAVAGLLEILAANSD